MKIHNLVTAAFLLLFLFSCRKDDGATTYQIVNKIDEDFIRRITTLDDPFLDGTLYEVLVLCYDQSGQLVEVDTLNPIDHSGGMSDRIEVDPKCAKVKPSFKVLPSRSVNFEYAPRVFLYDFTILKEGKNTQIIIDGNNKITNELKNLNEMIMDASICDQ